MVATDQELERLYRTRYLGLVEAVATITRGYDGAHDAVQEGFARALAGLSGFRGGSLDAWVVRIVLNAAIDARRRDRDQPLDDSMPEPQLLDPERDYAVVAAIRDLSPRRRMVVFLRYYADLSYAEIAEITGLAVGTVAATLNQAHAALRDALTHATEPKR
jgi:RNA polymerase sigma-70 factor, ECF subfamily